MTQHSLLTATILDIVSQGNPPYTAQGISRLVAQRIPGTGHGLVVEELNRLTHKKQVVRISADRLPSRYKLPTAERKAAP